MGRVRARRRSGFTLIELMVTVGILGVLAAIAIPSLASMTRRAKAGEASANLNSMYKGAASLYLAERTLRGVTATIVANCVAEPTPMMPATPNTQKQRFTAIEGFGQLSFHIADYVYYGYGIRSIGADGAVTCYDDPPSPTSSIYTFYAHGDLNGDHVFSTFEVTVGSEGAGQLRRSRGMYIVAEPE